MKLSQEQKNAICHIKGPALILAVPGAGKTTVLVHRTYNLIYNHKVNPSRILSITFSKSSARDMKARFDQVVPRDFISNRVSFSTIHSFCFELLREYAFINKIKYQLIEDSKLEINKYNLIKKIYLEVNKEYITEDKLESIFNSISYIKNMMISVEEYLKSENPNIPNLPKIYATYENYKEKNRMIDFDDMLTLSWNILKNDSYLLNKYREKYDFIQVDEGQDTSKVQMEIIKLLSAPKNNVLIVADDDQSIYGFRGAYPEGLLNFNTMYKDGKIFFMEKNYRSTKNIVSISNKFIKTNKKRYEKNILTDNDYLEPINIIKLKNKEDQYEYLMEKLKDRDLPNAAILYRNNLSSIGIINALEKKKILFYMGDKKIRFFSHWLVYDILQIMTFANNTSDLSLYENFYYKIKGYISKKHINYAKTLNKDQGVFERIGQYPGINDFYKKNLRELKFDFKKLSKLKPREAILYIENNLQYQDYLKENSIKTDSYDNLNNILYYMKLIGDSCQDLNDFINRLKSIDYLCKNSNNNNKSLTLSTIHSSKGLEFDKVYIIDLIEGEFPNNSSIESFNKGEADLLEEERRLFYVGMTRAKNHLTLLTTKNINGKSVENSRFIKELENK